MSKKIVIGTRGSHLALAQAEEIRSSLAKIWGIEFEFEIKIIRTTGDELQKGGGVAKPPKGLFTKEIEEELKAEKIHLAVHSCKDLPTEISDEFCLAAISKRISARDILILKDGLDKDHLSDGEIILTGSPRRKVQWLWRHPKTQVEAIRGNVDTRVRKLLENEKWHGLILAEAGLLRRKLSLDGVKVYPFSLDEMLPAPGQGALAIETRRDDVLTREIVAKVNDAMSERQVLAERSFLREMGGGCRSPIAGYAEVLQEKTLKLHGVVFDKDGEHRDFVLGEDSVKLGQELAGKLKKFL